MLGRIVIKVTGIYSSDIIRDINTGFPMKKKDIHILDTREKTDHVIQETRVVLPGTQAILGFQLASFFSSCV